jgi:hypothetical protein
MYRHITPLYTPKKKYIYLDIYMILPIYSISIYIYYIHQKKNQRFWPIPILTPGFTWFQPEKSFGFRRRRCLGFRLRFPDILNPTIQENISKHFQISYICYLRFPAIFNLVGGFNQPPWKMMEWKSDWIIIPSIMENKKCSKPPTSNDIQEIIQYYPSNSTKLSITIIHEYLWNSKKSYIE